ncbi:MAG TPA: type II secretion system F family protein [Gammaproteobacteria bacterium]|nr:type II secretion system F family protein [Gammaproteobacteria bacterium]
MPAVKKATPTTTAPKSATFTYEVTNQQGKTIKGELTALNLALAKAELRRQGFTPVKVRRKNKSFLSGVRKKRISSEDISFYSRQMATMMTAGVPLVQSFDIVARGTDNLSLRDLILSVKAEVEAGRSYAEALEKFPQHFDHLFCNLVAAGEASGSLETMLDRIATYKEKAESLKRKIKKALFYPIAVMIVAVVVTFILLIFVVPQFEQLFKGFGADLPAFTRMVINISEFVQSYWYIILGLAIIGIWAFIYFKKRSTKFQHMLERLSLKIPIIGNILHKASIARYARTLATTFAAGVPLIEALDSVAGATGNIVYAEAVWRIRDDVAMGSQVQASMRSTNIFPNMVTQMVAIGEESGSLDEMLSKVADIYEEEVDAAVDGLSSLLEPLIMVILGVLVGGLVIAMYLPIFKMGSVV